jgi:2',3'-cyclic-nucleotide 2'-phosphodiesterase
LTTILFVGDVVGSTGRQVIRSMLSELRDEFAADFVVVNGENASGGIGITPKHAEEIFGAGADVITLGNHTYRHREVWPYLAERREIVRPANFLSSQPGRGAVVVEREGRSLGVLNLAGNLYMGHAAPALLVADEALGQLRSADVVLVDMHAEATSEKVAMGWHLDGRVAAVVGTHTHIPTADARVLPNGTAYVTDVGMTGARGGVIGVRKEQSIAVMRTHMPQRYDPAEDDPWINAVVIRCGDNGRAAAIEQILRPFER